MRGKDRKDMKIVYSTPEHDIARVYVAELSDGSRIEFVGSTQPPYTKEEKLVIIVSTLKGCPVDCAFCDAGGNYKGRLTKNEMLEQIDFVIKNNFSNGKPGTKRLKIQFARMGEPAFNPEVLNVLKELPDHYDANILMPSISTIAPRNCDPFFEELPHIKSSLYSDGRFQMQFSIHTTDENLKKTLIPAETWNLKEIADYGERFWRPGDRKITLNFASPKGYPIDAVMLKEYFNPKKYLVKLTPVNPTKKAEKNKIKPLIDADTPGKSKNVCDSLKNAGYEVILSIGELAENQIGSNCGMYIDKEL